MKTLNKFRWTNKFCITSGDVQAMATIAKFLKDRGHSLVAIANSEDMDCCHYTVRASTPDNGLYDARVAVYCDVRVEETVWIIKERQVA